MPVKKANEDFLSALVAPAQRALKSKGIITVQKLSKFSEAEIKTLHGMGPSTLPKLKAALRNAGLKFREEKSGTKNSKGTGGLTAKSFIEKLQKLQSDKEKEKLQRYFKTGEGDYGAGDEFMGVKMGSLFKLAIESRGMPISEIEKLLESKIHEVRAGAVSIMDKESRYPKTTPERRKEFYDLYMRRHDRINNWDLCDLGCLHMIGCHLYDKPRQVLYKMAKSKVIWERRTAILGTCYFIRQGEIEDTFKIGELLLKDKEDLIHKATGWMLRFAGAKDQKRLLALLDKHAATMPRTLLRSCIEGLSKKQREYYMALKK